MTRPAYDARGIHLIPNLSLEDARRQRLSAVELRRIRSSVAQISRWMDTVFELPLTLPAPSTARTR